MGVKSCSASIRETPNASVLSTVPTGPGYRWFCPAGTGTGRNGTLPVPRVVVCPGSPRCLFTGTFPGLYLFGAIVSVVKCDAATYTYLSGRRLGITAPIRRRNPGLYVAWELSGRHHVLPEIGRKHRGTCRTAVPVLGPATSKLSRASQSRGSPRPTRRPAQLNHPSVFRLQVCAKHRFGLSGDKSADDCRRGHAP